MVKGRGDIITVDIERTIHQQLLSIAKTRDLSLRKLVNEILLSNIEKDQFIKSIAPKFSLIEFTEDSILIRDKYAKKTRFAEITIKNEKMWCSLDEDSVCGHIHFALMFPELTNLKGSLKQI